MLNSYNKDKSIAMQFHSHLRLPYLLFICACPFNIPFFHSNKFEELSAVAFWLNAAGHLMNRQTRKRVRQKATPPFLNLAAGRGQVVKISHAERHSER